MCTYVVMCESGIFIFCCGDLVDRVGGNLWLLTIFFFFELGMSLLS